MLTFTLAGCRAPSTGLDMSSMQVDTVWYAAARKRESNRLGFALADSLEYGYYRVATRRGIDATRDALDMRIIDSTRVPGQEFLSAIAAPSADSNGVVVLAVHGFKTTHNKSIRDAAESYRRSGTKARWIAFSWPSTGRGVSWFVPDGFITGAYRADSTAAAKSRPAFAGLARAIHEAVGGKRLVIASHSLGGQIVSESLAHDEALHARLTADPIRALGLFEPDVPADRFVDDNMPRLRPLASRIALYASRNDLILRMSRLVNRSERAGLIEVAPVVTDKLETIDATSGISSENFLRRSFGTHHGMRRESGALRDFFEIVVPGLPPECRTIRGRANQIGESSWRLIATHGSNDSCDTR